MQLLDTERLGLGSASGAYLTSLCPGNIALRNELRTRGILIEVADPLTAAGNRIHAKRSGAEIELTPEEQEIASGMVRLRNRLIDAWSDGELMIEEADQGTEYCDGRYEVFREERLWYRVGLEPLFSGQLDLAVIDRVKPRGLVLDYKSGFMDLPPTGQNLQIRSEVVLLKHNYPELERVDGEIVQPRVKWDPILVYHDEKIMESAQSEIVGIFSNALYDKTLKPGEHCRWCDLKAQCQKALRYATSARSVAAEIESAIIKIPGGEKGSQTLDWIAAASKIFEAVQAAYKAELIKDPTFLPDRKIEPGYAKLADASKTWEFVKETLTLETFLSCVSIKVSELRKLVRAVKRWKVKDEKAAFEQLFKDLLSYGEARMEKLTKKELEALKTQAQLTDCSGEKQAGAAEGKVEAAPVSQEITE
jgi:hypothetical protein